MAAEFVNNLITVLNTLAAQMTASLDTLNFALAVSRSAEVDSGAAMALRQPRNSRHGFRPRIICARIGPFEISTAYEKSASGYIVHLVCARDVSSLA